MDGSGVAWRAMAWIGVAWVVGLPEHREAFKI